MATPIDSRRGVTQLRTADLKMDSPLGILESANGFTLKELGYRMVDDILESSAGVAERPVVPAIPLVVRAGFATPAPIVGVGEAAAYEEFKQTVMPYPRGNGHPRFWGWVNGSGLILAAYADLLASAMNPSVGVMESAATLVETQSLQWLKEILEMNQTASGVLTSGCSMSHIVCLAVARQWAVGAQVKRSGLSSCKPLVAYTSAEAHSSVTKAIELLGIGNEFLRRIPTDRDYRLDTEALQDQIVSDRQRGLKPFCVIATIGTVNTGSIDPIGKILSICRDEQLWCHIDGAFGALAWLSPSTRDALRGFQAADSIAFDLHKWMYLPYDIGCAFVRDAQIHQGTFEATASYLNPLDPPRVDTTCRFPDLGIELSRRFRALKVWMCLKAFGVQAFADSIDDNIQHARHLADIIARNADLELLAPVATNVVCFRHRYSPHVREANDFNRQILKRLQARNTEYPSHADLNGVFAIRASITNHRTTRRDLERLVESVLDIGAALRREAQCTENEVTH